MVDVVKLFNDYSVPYKIRKQGIVTVKCPFCESSSGKSAHQYTGAFLSGKAYSCFRCGKHRLTDAISELIGVCGDSVFILLRGYSTDEVFTKDEIAHPRSLKFPITKEIDAVYREYLYSRGYNVDYIVHKYHLMFTEHYGNARNAEIIASYDMLANRVVIPVYYKGYPISFTTRTIVKDLQPRYISCPADLEVIPHKSSLFNIDNCTKNIAVVFEAPMNVMKFGDGGVATFGTSWTLPQANLLKEFRRVYIVYDSGEEDAQRKAHGLANLLNMTTQCFVVDTETPGRDVGDFNDDEIKEMRRMLGFSE